jgi:hypothetical protein
MAGTVGLEPTIGRLFSLSINRKGEKKQKKFKQNKWGLMDFLVSFPYILLPADGSVKLPGQLFFCFIGSFKIPSSSEHCAYHGSSCLMG